MGFIFFGKYINIISDFKQVEYNIYDVVSDFYSLHVAMIMKIRRAIWNISSISLLRLQRRNIINAQLKLIRDVYA